MISVFSVPSVAKETTLKPVLSKTCLSLLVVMAGCVVGPKPDPQPTDDLTVIIGQSLVVYAQLFADVLEEEATYVEAHPETNAHQSQQRIRKATEAARIAAFEPFDKTVQKMIGGEKWNSTDAPNAYREIAKQVRAVK